MVYVPAMPPMDCTACGACINVCPVQAFSWSLNGRLEEVPVINASLCIGCGKCEQACPQKSEFQDGMFPGKVFAAWLKDASELEKSASGGAACALSKVVVAQGGIVFGCVFSSGKARHVSVEEISSITSLSGSKYVWSDTGDSFACIKRSLTEKPDRPVLFIGTPCQVAGLKGFLGSALSASSSLITVDLICHGVPPAKYLEEYLRETYDKKAAIVRFRDREAFLLSGTFENGQPFCQKRSLSSKDGIYRNLYFDAYLAAFLNGVSYRENCYSCRYARPERVSDITLGDAWGAVEKGMLPPDAPEMASLVFINTPQGASWFAQGTVLLEAHELSVIRSISGKDNMNHPTIQPSERDVFLADISDKGIGFAFNAWLENKKTARIKERTSVRFLLRKMLNAADSVIKKGLEFGEKLLFQTDIHKEKKLIQITTIGKDYLLNNYGTFLQHFALRYFLKRNGYVAVRNHWDERTCGLFYERYRWWRPHLISKYYIPLTIQVLFHNLGVCRRDNIYALRQRLTRMIRFRNSYGRMIGRIIEEPKRLPDVCITGSDQVFGSNALREQIHLLLQDVPVTMPKIAYAASSKWFSLPKYAVWNNTLKNALTGFSAIGIREKIGCSICSSLVPGKKVKHTADPTLLLTKDDYLQSIERNRIFTKKVLLCYMLHCDEKTLHLDWLEELAGKLHAELKIIGCQGTEDFVPEKYGFDPSPEDFLRAYRDADYVITNSFHGTVFALQFEKQWLTFNQESGDADSQNARHLDLLQGLDLENRAIIFENADRAERLLKSPVDWSLVKNRISAFRKESADWLLKAVRMAVTD